MKNRKVIISLLLSMLVILGAGACGRTEDKSTEPTTIAPTASQTGFKVDAKKRNKYRLNYYTRELDEFKPNKNGDYMIYPKAPYYDIFDELYADYTVADPTYDDGIDIDFYNKFRKSVRMASDNSDYLISDCKGGVCINKYTGEEKDLRIPETLDGKKVVKLGFDVYVGECDMSLDSPFEKCELKSITLPSGLRDIVNDALLGGFSNNLARIEVSKDNPYYTSVDGVLFTKDKSCLLFVPRYYPKADYEVPEGTKAVYSTPRGTVKIPESVISFGEDVKNYSANRIRNFSSDWVLNAYHMSQVKGFDVAPGNKYYSSENGVLYNKDKTVLIMYPELKKDSSFTIPDSVRVVNGGVNFSDTAIKVLTFGRNVRECYADCNFVYFENKKPDITIRGYKGTPAKQIAEENGYKYVELD